MKRLPASVCASLVLLGGCSQPPSKEIAAADELLKHARTSGAGEHAPERLAEAEAAMALARQKLEQRDYRGALSAALDAAEKSRQASQAAAAAQASARAAGEKALGQARDALGQADRYRKQAAAAGVPDRALADADRARDDVRRRADALSTALDKGALKGSEQQAQELRTRAADLAERYRAAQRRWQASRARVRPAPRRR